MRLPILLTTSCLVAASAISLPRIGRGTARPTTPALPKVPLLGSVPFLLPSVLEGIRSPSPIKPDVGAILSSAHTAHGANFKLTMPGLGRERVMSFVSDLGDAEHVLQRATKEFPDRGWLLDGLRHRVPYSLNAMPDDDSYRQHRAAVVQAFKRDNLFAYFDATVVECEELGDRLDAILDETDGVVEITDVILEHVMCNFGASVIGRSYTTSTAKSLERGAWQLQLGALFDLIVPRSLRFGQEWKDEAADRTMREVIEATIKAHKISTKADLRLAFAGQLGKEPTDLTAEENNGSEGLTKEQFFEAARMEKFRPELKDILFEYVNRGRSDGGKVNLKEFMDFLQDFIDNRVKLFYDIVKFKNDGDFDLEMFVNLLAPTAFSDVNLDECEEKVRRELSLDGPIDDVSLRANLRKENSTLGDFLADGSALGSVGRQVQRIFGASRSLLQNILTVPDKRGLILPTDQVLDCIVNTLLAGYFSTAMTTTWVAWKLAREKEWQDKMYKELKDVGGFRQLAIGTLSQDMPASRAFIYECMRTFPTVPVHARRASEDVTLPSNFTVRKDELVLINNFKIFTDAATWGEDADVFDPTRWMEGDYLGNHVPQGPPEGVATKCPITNAVTAASKYAYAPFGHGHRACPAPEFALSVIQLTLLKLVEKAEMEPHHNLVTSRLPGDLGDAVIPSIGFALGNIGGCYLKLRRRRA